MPFDVNFRTHPGEWGITKMMERIEYLTARFDSMIPKAQAESEFRAELNNSLSQQKVSASPAAATEAGLETGSLMSPQQLLSYSQVYSTGAGYPVLGQTVAADNLSNGGIDISRIIRAASEKYNLDPGILTGIIKTESNFNPNAVSSKGAMGLMQLMPGTARDLDVSNPFDPEQNVDGGARYFRMMLDRFGGDPALALSAYNAGPKAVETYKGVPPYSETKDYVQKILGTLTQDE